MVADEDELFRQKIRALAASIKVRPVEPLPPIRHDDDLIPPAFLKRNSSKLTDTQLRALLNPKTEWIMPSTRIEENTMAKADFLIENRDAPVVVYRYTGEVTSGAPLDKFHEFKTADDFEAWYRPNKMRFVGQNTQDTFTDVMLEFDAKTSPVVEAVNGKANRFKVKLPPTTGSRREDATISESKLKRPMRDTRGRYVDKRHVAKITAAGFKQTSNDPITFVRGKTTVVIAPPPEGKAWSSDWTIDGKRSGRGVTTLLEALGDKS